jgi:hypothetical protein
VVSTRTVSPWFIPMDLRVGLSKGMGIEVGGTPHRTD